MKSSYYRSLGVTDDGAERVESSPATAGPWAATAQHGGPPTALLARSIERLLEPDRLVARITVDLLGAIPVGPLRVSGSVLRPGRSVALLQSELYDETAGRVVARAQAWSLPLTDDGPVQDAVPPTHGPDDGRVGSRPPGWGSGYLDTIDWRWVSGRLGEPGPAVAWMRPTVPLVDDEEMTGLQRLLTCVDSASGVSSALDIREWAFMNTELTVTLLRPVTGDWICLDAVTALGPGAVGLATSTVSDLAGPVGRSSQTLLVQHR